MNAIKVETTVDEATARAIPAIRPLLGQCVELIALQTESTEQTPRKRITLDEFLTHRLAPPPGVTLSLDDMERAIEQGRRVESIDTNVVVRLVVRDNEAQAQRALPG